MSLKKIAKALRGGHGCIFFSPTKGYHCDLMCQDKKQSWVTGSGDGIVEAVQDAIRKKEALESAETEKDP